MGRISKARSNPPLARTMTLMKFKNLLPMKWKNLLPISLVASLLGGPVWGTETENLGIRSLPAPGKVTVDGKADDWDLSGGIFVCGDAENLRDQLAVWLHLMYDSENLYILARWSDDTPMNNPGDAGGDQSFAGDCLQFRTVVFKEDPKLGGQTEPATQRTTHISAWQDRHGVGVVELQYGARFDQGAMKDARAAGAAQAFFKNEDGKGYVQELAIPWKLLAPEGWTPQAGGKFICTVEPNFGTDTKFRITLKDIFRPGVTPDRVFTFANNPIWGIATLAPKGKVEPQSTRLADAREFPVRLGCDLAHGNRPASGGLGG